MSEVDKRLQVSLHTPSGYFSEAVAISQKAINQNLDNLLKLYPDFATINISAHDGNMDAKLDSGRVALHILDGNRSMVDYFCTFKSGTVSVWDDDLDNFTDPIDMTGWVFAFAVNMGSADVDKSTDEYQEIASAFAHPGDYSISRLYLDFNSNQIASFNKDASSFGTYNFSDSGLISFQAIMLKWADAVVNKVDEEPRKVTVGYASKAIDPNSVNEAAPTFPPTSLRFQNYEYIKPGGKSPTDGPGDKGDHNVLLYLEMTQHLDLPSDPLPYSGNFVTPVMDGTICISKEVFMESYLLRETGPLLNTLNQYTYSWIQPDRNIHASQRISHPEQYLHVGPGSAKDRDLSFFRFMPVSGSSTQWMWSPADQYTDDSPKEIKLELWTSSSSELEVHPGTNQMSLSGTTSLHFKNQDWFDIIWASGCESKVTATWSINATLDSVKEGGLKISLNLPSDPSAVFDVGKPSWGEWPFGNLYPPYANDLKNNLVDALTNTPLLDVATQLQTNLTGASRFVVPGGGVFFYKDPIFSESGDLLIEAKYDGV